MKILKKTLKIVGLTLLLLVTTISIYIYKSGPDLPKGTNRIINQAIKADPPELIRGQEAYAQSGDASIWYESIMPATSSKGTVLLIMGISMDGLGWPLSFIEPFVGAGYQVIRYDHRDTGMSDWESKEVYDLSDMADDAMAILNALKIDKAHIIGASMGGMIAQEITINYPDRVASLTSIMSTADAYDPELPGISKDIALDLIKAGIKYSIIGGEKSHIKLNLTARYILRGGATNEINTKEISNQVLYTIRKRRGFNSAASRQHQKAVTFSRPRSHALKEVNVPALIIHGRQDPFIPIAHGRKTARLIPNADSLWVDNMGHDLPEALIPEITEAIISHFTIKKP